MSIAKKKFTVHRGMHGDGKDYARGDTRMMTEADAATLVATGALALEGGNPHVAEPGVQHTFGTAPSRLNDRGYTSASGEGLSLSRNSAKAKVKADAAAEPVIPAGSAAPVEPAVPVAPARPVEPAEQAQG